MKRSLLEVVAIMPITMASFGCRSSRELSQTPSPGETKKLTASNVQSAVDRVVDWTRKGGGVAVTGIQEDPGQNEARADLQFNGFQYNANGFVNIPKPKNEVTPPPPETNSPTFYEDMANIPARERHVATYSGPGVATLKHYNDGRWVLTQVEFNFNQLNSNVNIQ